jgi:hypothetical protein
LYYEQLTKITKLTFKVMPHFYLRTSRVWTACPSGSRKRKADRSDSIRSIGLVRTRYSAYLCGSTTCRGRGTVTYQSESAHQTSNWTGLCRMEHTYFAEFLFHALG